ncbi:hypothetical protein BAE44_0020292 [Dichanthelium oligosanthes]|uniref:RING-type E3 ubiquitin transferase n=1 Tax=Dichanthelium oligosanthes TaxID=888268 RepID=A0A1E5V0K6_9POAL|nr:hypothetical protein BAE44_0020292 [Dichanthelium oligosanthes]
MAPHNLAACRLCVVLLLLLLSAALSSAASSPSTLDSAICTIPSNPPERLPSDKHNALAALKVFQLNAGYFFGGEDIHFAKDDSNASFVTRSFSLFPHSVDLTTDHNLLHVAATLALSGGRARSILTARRRRHRYVGGHSVNFYLNGYYSYTSEELCMTGSGTYSSDEGSIEHLEGVVLKLRMPRRSKLSDPFVTGRLKGASFEAISLVAYAQGAYHYSESGVSCRSLQPSSTPARGALQGLGASFSCAHLKEHLETSYKLQYGGGAHAPGSSPLMGLQARRMHIGQVQCTAAGDVVEVRAYAVFSNDTKMWGQLKPHPPFMGDEEVVVAEGRWNSERSMLCVTACRVEHSGITSPAVKECGIGMSFWFPGAWTIRDRSFLVGMIWNSSQAAGGTDSSGVISVSSIDANDHRSNFADVKYDYTMVEEAKKHYLNDPVLSDPKKKVQGSFVAPNYTDHDFAFSFYETKDRVGSGQAYPVTIGSAMVYGDRLAADDSFSGQAVVDMKQELVNVSYDIRQHVPPADWVRPKNSSSYAVSLEERQITAEGVFDPKTGVMCMIACREDNSLTADCQILITIHFASLDGKAQGHGKGAISSLRNKATDPLFFEKTEIMLYGMYTDQVSESVSRMDLESIMLVISTTLPCIFTVLQILHVKRRPEAAAATSITMLVVLALGYVAPLVVSSEALFLSRRRQYAPTPFRSYVPYELSQAMMRAPTLIALLLQLRLIQLAWSARKTKDDARRSAAEASSAAERRALWLCVPVYLIGGALAIIVHAMNVRRAAQEDSLTVRIGPEPATLWEDLVSSAGLALDAFLLPQVVMNALSAGARVRALSLWFYVGGTVVRAMPHVYDVFRAQGYAQSVRSSYVYASPRYDRFGVAWDVVVPCGAAVLAVLLFLQQRIRLAPPLFPSRRRLGEYQMVSNL